ncbi:phosphatidylserine decarboxylase [Marinivivus vitaminiproducens]|uniref:phosphatidylserine decarboxylase n=1 Tax=Marinivivus vitaminiproducens TaxID=3035935 RepID=UPI0027A706E1|nr:phosphatidylserine decarboxylase [Geminicoccaceae bacterium SCSIO 64248]
MASPSALATVLAPVHRAGWPFVAIAAVVTLLLALVAQPLFWLGLILTAWVAYFFRDPARVTPDDPDLVISPADGTVQTVGLRTPPAELGLGDEPVPCVCIFMNVFDVHINRAPVSGAVERKVYRPGKFLNAALDKASEDNERLGWVLRTAGGERFALVQIAGLVARRIKSFAQEGQTLAAGERLGLIRFGSRCDVYMPQGMAPLVCVGQKTLAGETVLADGRRNVQARAGVVR